MKYRKGTTLLAAIQVITIAMLVFFVLLPTADKTAVTIDTSTRIKACATSIQAADASKYAFGPISSGRTKVKVHCPRDIAILDSDILETSLFSKPVVNHIKLTEEIGDLMVEAYKAANEFRSDPWSDVDLGRSGKDVEEMVFCFVWADIAIPPKVQKQLEKNPELKLEVPLTTLCEKGYCETIFGTDDPEKLKHLPEVENGKYIIKDGSYLLMRLYKPDLREPNINPARLYKYSCPECGGTWSMSIVSPETPFADKAIFVMKNGEILKTVKEESTAMAIFKATAAPALYIVEKIIEDPQKTEIVRKPWCSRLLN